MKIGYARVSTRDQNLDMQMTALRKAGCSSIYFEKVSGVRQRPELERCLQALRQDDTLVVFKLDRIGRSLKNLVEIIESLNERGIGLISIKDNIDASTSGGKLVMHIFASLAEFERDMIADRCQAGRQEAKKRGTKFGRKPGVPTDKVKACAALYKEGLTIRALQEQLGIKSKSTVYTYLKMANVKLRENKKLYSKE